MKKRQVILRGKPQRDFAHSLIDSAMDGDYVTISKPTRSLRQNSLLWELIGDLKHQVPEMAGFALDDIKLRFLNALGAEMRFLPTLENEGMFPVGLRSSTLTVAQFSGLIELIHEYGARHGVAFKDRKEDL